MQNNFSPSDITRLVIKPITKIQALELIFDNHYSKIMPRLTKHYIGGFVDDVLVGVITLGWGVRPIHTIKILFPSLNRTDYFEIGKMCMDEKMPKNSESVFLSRTIRWLKANTNCKVLFTWADGILGKPGYVYQAANFSYGGLFGPICILLTPAKKFILVQHNLYQRMPK